MYISDDGDTIYGLSEKEVLKYEYTAAKNIGVNS
jgi:hypothetical protein